MRAMLNASKQRDRNTETAEAKLLLEEFRLIGDVIYPSFDPE